MWEKSKGTTKCEKRAVICNVETAQCEDEIVKCEKKNKGTTKCDKRTVTCDVKTTQYEDETVKYEKKAREPPNVTKELSYVIKIEQMWCWYCLIWQWNHQIWERLNKLLYVIK